MDSPRKMVFDTDFRQNETININTYGNHIEPAEFPH